MFHLFPLFLLVDVLLYRRRDSNLLSLWRQGYGLLHLSVGAATVCPLMFIVSGVETSRRASQQCALLMPCLPREVEDQRNAMESNHQAVNLYRLSKPAAHHARTFQTPAFNVRR